MISKASHLKGLELTKILSTGHVSNNINEHIVVHDMISLKDSTIKYFKFDLKQKVLDNSTVLLEQCYQLYLTEFVSKSNHVT